MALNYLLDPVFQIQNSAGKPVTDGWLEVYIHGTRTKYYCASDFNGTLHPFKIPLDSLGSNIVLAEDWQAYDVYAYNRFGSLLMSRYNVTPGKGGSGSGEMQHWIGGNGATYYDLPGDSAGHTLEISNQDVEYVGDFIDHISSNREIYLRPGLYHIDCTIRYKQDPGVLKNTLDGVLVYTGNGVADEDIAYQLDASGPETTDNRHCLKQSFIRKVTESSGNVLYFAPATPTKWAWAFIQRLSIVRLDAGAGEQGAGLESVHHDETLTGDGTLTNPLSVVAGGGQYTSPNETITIEGDTLEATRYAMKTVDIDEEWELNGISHNINEHWEQRSGRINLDGTEHVFIAIGHESGDTEKPQFPGGRTLTVECHHQDGTVESFEDLTMDDFVPRVINGGTYYMYELPRNLSSYYYTGSGSSFDDPKLMLRDFFYTAGEHTSEKAPLAWLSDIPEIDSQMDIDSHNAVENGVIVNFVNSSIATNTAYFLGTYDPDIEELDFDEWLAEKDPTNNDYVFEISEDEDGNTIYNRWKYNSDSEEWSFEYTLNNSSFTAAQWAAVNSGITADKVAEIGKAKVHQNDTADYLTSKIVAGNGISKQVQTTGDASAITLSVKVDGTTINFDSDGMLAAVGGGGASDHKVCVNANDTNPGFLAAKLTRYVDDCIYIRTLNNDRVAIDMQYDPETLETKDINGEKHLTVKVASMDSPSGLVDWALLQEIIEAVQSRICETMPFGTLNNQVGPTGGQEQSCKLYLSGFVPQYNFNLKNDTQAGELTKCGVYVSQTAGAIICPVLYKLENRGSYMSPAYRLKLVALWSYIYLAGAQSEKRRHNSTSILYLDPDETKMKSGDTYYMGFFTFNNGIQVLGVDVGNTAYSVPNWPVLSCSFENQYKTVNSSNPSTVWNAKPLKYLYLNNDNTAQDPGDNAIFDPGTGTWTAGTFSQALGNVSTIKPYAILDNYAE